MVFPLPDPDDGVPLSPRKKGLLDGANLESEESIDRVLDLLGQEEGSGSSEEEDDDGDIDMGVGTGLGLKKAGMKSDYPGIGGAEDRTKKLAFA